MKMLQRQASLATGLVMGALMVAVSVAVAQGDICHSKTQCDSCLQTPGCMWCSSTPKTNHSGKFYHCEDINTDRESFCDEDDIHNIKNVVTIVDNKPLTTVETPEEKAAGSGVRKDIIQLTPQKIKLKLRRGTPQNVTIKFRQAQGYPIDLYYLMDLSNSMSDDKKTLASLGSLLTRNMMKLTNQFALGFGSFVDKVVLPFTDTSPSKLHNPCRGCPIAYSFRNDLSLTNNTDMFKSSVEAANISGNLDAPEGGFDALMQVMVCKEKIGWRDQARHLIVYSSDNKVHYAGSGRLAGIVRPNDEQCHLNDKGEYDKYDEYDYPSISQINRVAKQQNMNIIFAVSSNGELYKDLSKRIETSSYGALTGNSSNVVNLVKKQYKKISSTLTLHDNSSNTPISIYYLAQCKDQDIQATQECKGIREGDEATFTLEITASECLKDEKVILEVKTLQDRVIIEVEVDCSCNCTSVEKSPSCFGNGALVCGVCSCNDGYWGNNCKCSTNDIYEESEGDKSQCKANPEDTLLCSGQGSCSCGECFCQSQDVSGTFCECNRRKCFSGVGGVCSNHGFCDCNECKCDSGYAGEFCECRHESMCIKPGDDKVCSGHGACDCGKCKCNQSETFSYKGQYCEECPTCEAGKCTKFRDCVQCKFFKTGNKRDPDECNKCTIQATRKESLQDEILKGAQECTFPDLDDGCQFNFTYRYDEETISYEIVVLKGKVCPLEAPMMGIVFGLIGAIVAIGFLTLLIWKLVTTIHDEREFAKFEDDMKTVQWNTDENPLYTAPETTYQNPAYVMSAQQ